MSLIQKKSQILSHFKCQKSGNCCKCPGYVYVDDADISKMADIKGQSVESFTAAYVSRESGWKVVARPGFRPDCFLDEQNGCTVYEARPKACKTYPDWPEIWDSEESLLKELSICPGLKMAVKSISSES
jgi:uncharacterized protein